MAETVTTAGGVTIAGTLASLGDISPALFWLVFISVLTSRTGALVLAVEEGKSEWSVRLIVHNILYLGILTLIGLALIDIFHQFATIGWRIVICGAVGALGPEVLRGLRNIGRAIFKRLGVDIETTTTVPPTTVQNLKRVSVIPASTEGPTIPKELYDEQ